MNNHLSMRSGNPALKAETFKNIEGAASNKMTIDVIYIDGPLRKLQTKWKFKETKKNYTKVFFFIKFEFKNIIYQKLSEVFFDLLENKMINSFKKRADKILN